MNYILIVLLQVSFLVESRVTRSDVSAHKDASVEVTNTNYLSLSNVYNNTIPAPKLERALK